MVLFLSSDTTMVLFWWEKLIALQTASLVTVCVCVCSPFVCFLHLKSGAVECVTAGFEDGGLSLFFKGKRPQV